jgi:hypothetical protein
MYRMHAILLGSALCAGAGQFALADQPRAATAQQALWQPLDLEDAGSAVQQVQFSDYADDGSPWDEPLVTDRPDFTEASSTVGRGVNQLEMGYTFFYDDRESDVAIVRTHTAPEIIYRRGITDGAELRLGWNYTWERTQLGGTADTVDGANDLYLGTKLDVYEGHCHVPEQAVILQGFVPTGSEAFTTDEVEFGVNYLYSWELANDWSLAGSTGFDTLTEGEDDSVVWHQSVAVGVPLSDYWGMYIEYFGLYDTDRSVNVDQHFINGGLTYLVNYNLQLDFRAGIGLNDDSTDFFTGTGASIRF